MVARFARPGPRDPARQIHKTESAINGATPSIADF
jgi:hypothetical protein